MKWIIIILLLLNINVYAKSLNLNDYRKACHVGNGYACKKAAHTYLMYGNKYSARVYMWKACDLDVEGTCRMAKIYELLNN